MCLVILKGCFCVLKTGIQLDGPLFLNCVGATAIIKGVSWELHLCSRMNLLGDSWDDKPKMNCCYNYLVPHNFSDNPSSAHPSVDLISRPFWRDNCFKL